MSELKAYRIDECGRMIEDSEPDEDSWVVWQDAQSQVAALREELATAKRNEHNSEVAYKAAIEKQNELRTELAELEEEFDTLEHTNITLKQRLADAERRNADFATELKTTKQAMESLKGERTYADNSKCMLITLISRASECGGLTEDWHEAFESALNPKPEAASHDE